MLLLKFYNRILSQNQKEYFCFSYLFEIIKLKHHFNSSTKTQDIKKDAFVSSENFRVF